jgi:pimeloyl-ACP methyl ester carboxylesterase
MTERMISANGAELATEAFGDPTHPPILLLMGGMASMLWWPDEFCRRLASHHRHVIRFDQRDTGHSTKYPPGKAPYSLDDFVADALGVLDEYGIERAHIVGMSLGGMIGQAAAIQQPSRVLSLTAISSSPLGTDTSHLPSLSEAVLAQMNREVDWTNRDQAIDYMVEDSRVIAGVAHPFDAVKARAFIERDHDRSNGYLNATNHGYLKMGDAWRGRLGDMRTPLLVIHGTADPIYPIEHGIALSEAVSGTTLVRIEGGGHELHMADWDTIIGAIVKHASTK